MAKDLFNRYIWLADTIYRAGKITFEQIQDKWNKCDYNYGEELSLRTFHNHRKAVESLFDIDIECTKSNGYYYYIANSDDINSNVVKNWLLDTFTVSNLINESHHLKDRIIYEDVPSGKKYLTTIIEAMRDSHPIAVQYQSFTSETPKHHIIEPYCVKIFKQRWYLIGKDTDKKTVRIYALDRVKDVNVKQEKFSMPKSFTPDKFFSTSFGIIVDKSVQPQLIRIKVVAYDTNFFRELPLHHSQKEVETTKEYSVFQYYLAPTYDFYQQILSFGERIEIIYPQNVRQELLQTISKMNEIYSKPTK